MVTLLPQCFQMYMCHTENLMNSYIADTVNPAKDLCPAQVVTGNL